MNIASLIIKETENWVALHKPSGLLSIPDRMGKEISLKDLLIKHYGSIYVVHRIDKDTSGIILFAKNAESHQYLSGLFETKQVNKEYKALVNGIPSSTSGTVENFLSAHPTKAPMQVITKKGKLAITHYNVIESFKNYSFISFIIETGRTHQIRVHCNYLGIPIVGDLLYGDGKGIYVSSLKKKFQLAKNVLEERPIMGRLALHAHILSFTDTDNVAYTLEAALPKDFTASINQLKKHH
jgi:23S rRNA pseudouridine1911/1915/1917 synthase